MMHNLFSDANVHSQEIDAKIEQYRRLQPYNANKADVLLFGHRRASNRAASNILQRFIVSMANLFQPLST